MAMCALWFADKCCQVLCLWINMSLEGKMAREKPDNNNAVLRISKPIIFLISTPHRRRGVQLFSVINSKEDREPASPESTKGGW